jgi:pimeloyl-ACP methyl ester carboxylesterase
MPLATNRSDATRISYDVHGRGDPLVLFHGSATSSTLWHELGYLDAFADYRLISIDGRGHGRSDKPLQEDAYALERFVEDVLAVLDGLAIERAHFFGYSLGGRLGYALAAAAPERLESLVIAGGSRQPQRGALDRLIYPGFIDTIASEGIAAFLDRWSAHLGRPIDSSVRSVFLANDPAALVAYLRRTEEEPGFSDEVLSRIELPVLLLAGGYDHERLEDSCTAAAVLPNAELAVIEGADHFSALFQLDQVVRRLHEFLLRVGAGAGGGRTSSRAADLKGATRDAPGSEASAVGTSRLPV